MIWKKSKVLVHSQWSRRPINQALSMCNTIPLSGSNRELFALLRQHHFLNRVRKFPHQPKRYQHRFFPGRRTLLHTQAWWGQWLRMGATFQHFNAPTWVTSQRYPGSAASELTPNYIKSSEISDADDVGLVSKNAHHLRGCHLQCSLPVKEHGAPCNTIVKIVRCIDTPITYDIL